MGLPIPETPSVFTKPAQSLADPGTSIPIPLAAQDEQLDYEVELAIVIGKTCKGVSSEEAMNYVLGWTCANDLTARKQQKVTSQWVFAKGKLHRSLLSPALTSQASTSSALSVHVLSRPARYPTRTSSRSRLTSTATLSRTARRQR